MEYLSKLSDFERDSLKNYAKNIMGVEPATLLGIILTECSAKPFDSKERIVIQFEGHVFYTMLLKHGFDPDAIHTQEPDLCYLHWTQEYYRAGTEDDYQRLERAKRISPEAALESCSWGIGQLMGFHWKRLGYNSVHDFVMSNSSAVGQLINFAKFLMSGKEIEALRKKDMHKFFTLYNGAGYMKHGYNVRFDQNKKYAIDSGW